VLLGEGAELRQRPSNVASKKAPYAMQEMDRHRSDVHRTGSGEYGGRTFYRSLHRASDNCRVDKDAGGRTVAKGGIDPKFS
jgi:hypothetical protein